MTGGASRGRPCPSETPCQNKPKRKYSLRNRRCRPPASSSNSTPVSRTSSRWPSERVFPCGDDASRRALTREWYGFVHAAVVYGLMAQASNQVMAEYLRSTRTLLSQMAGYTPEQIESFIDDTFSSYIRLMAQNQQKQCPSLFYQRLVGEGALETLPKERVAFLSGMMAITMCAILDKLGQYEFGVE